MNKHKAFYCLLFTICVSHAAENKRQQIPDVVIQHSLLQTSFTGAPKHILTQQVITTNGSATLTDMLRSAGGLQLHDASGNGSQAAISMRGFGANAASNTLILLNGIPLTNPDLAPPDINTIPLENISQVEIIAGSESVLYGDQAVGGVINILTDHTQDKNIRLQCSGGSYNARECHARFANFYRDLNYQLSLTGKSTDNYRQHNQYDNATVYGSASFKKKFKCHCTGLQIYL